MRMVAPIVNKNFTDYVDIVGKKPLSDRTRKDITTNDASLCSFVAKQWGCSTKNLRNCGQQIL